MSKFTFLSPNSLEEAFAAIRETPHPEGVFMSGGTDLLLQRRHKLIDPKTVVYLKNIPSLSGIRSTEDGGLAIGAMTTLDDVADSPLVKDGCPMLAQAAFSVASVQIRHKATLGGNICLNTRCWFYNRSPFWRSQYPDCRKAAGGATCYVVPKSRKGCFALQSGDTAGPLTALDARIKLVSDEGERIVKIENFYLNDGIENLDLKPDEILTEVILPPAPGPGSFFKCRPQNNMDFATFTLSVLPPLKDAQSRIVVGSVASRPLRAREAEDIFNQGSRDFAAIARTAVKELKLVSFVRGSVDYKKQAIEAHLTRILEHSVRQRG